MTQGFDIDELERLLAAATPGEWAVGDDGGIPFPEITLAGSPFELASFTAGEDADENMANTYLTVALRNSLPAILTEIRELRAENARLKDALSHAQGRFRNINIALSSGGTKREAIRIADVGEDCAKNAIARAALGEPQ